MGQPMQSWRCLAFLFLFFPQAASIDLHTYLYHGTPEMRNNPERGFRHELHPDGNGTLSQAVLDQLRQYNLTVTQVYWYLPAADSVLSNNTLQGVVKTLRTLRGVGVKALFRFAYDRCNHGPIGENNYTAATIMGHISQLAKPFLGEIDVVYVLQAGFVGCWGEWHGSRNLPDPFGPERRSVQQIFRAMLFDLLPPDRKVTIRYPALKFDVVLQRDCPQLDPSAANGHRSNLQCGGFNTSAPTGVQPAPSSDMAFGIATASNSKQNTAVARLGYDNDAFMCDQIGSGTWVGGAQHDGDVPRTSRVDPRTHRNDPRDGPNGQIPDAMSYGDPVFNSAHGPMLGPGFQYERAESPFVPMDAEMGWNVGLEPYPQNKNSTWPLKVPAEVAAWRLREMHYSTMSLMHGYSHLDGNGRGHTPHPNNNETIDYWMRTPLNVTQASRDFRLPIAPEYARADKSGYEYIRDHLGYRLELRSARLPLEVNVSGADGASISFTFTAALVNWGFAAPVSWRPVRLVLLATNATTVWTSVNLAADPRDWQPYVPGDPTFLPLLHRLECDVSIPTSVLRCGGSEASCAFNFGLYMPDMRMDKVVAEEAASYCIRMANSNMSWVGGVNLISEMIVHHS